MAEEPKEGLNGLESLVGWWYKMEEGMQGEKWEDPEIEGMAEEIVEGWERRSKSLKGVNSSSRLAAQDLWDFAWSDKAKEVPETRASALLFCIKTGFIMLKEAERGEIIETIQAALEECAIKGDFDTYARMIAEAGEIGISLEDFSLQWLKQQEGRIIRGLQQRLPSFNRCCTFLTAVRGGQSVKKGLLTQDLSELVFQTAKGVILQEIQEARQKIQEGGRLPEYLARDILLGIQCGVVSQEDENVQKILAYALKQITQDCRQPHSPIITSPYPFLDIIELACEYGFINRPEDFKEVIMAILAHLYETKFWKYFAEALRVGLKIKAISWDERLSSPFLRGTLLEEVKHILSLDRPEFHPDLYVGYPLEVFFVAASSLGVNSLLEERVGKPMEKRWEEFIEKIIWPYRHTLVKEGEWKEYIKMLSDATSSGVLINLKGESITCREQIGQILEECREKGYWLTFFRILERATQAGIIDRENMEPYEEAIYAGLSYAAQHDAAGLVYSKILTSAINCGIDVRPSRISIAEAIRRLEEASEKYGAHRTYVEGILIILRSNLAGMLPTGYLEKLKRQARERLLKVILSDYKESGSHHLNAAYVLIAAVIAGIIPLEDLTDALTKALEEISQLLPPEPIPLKPIIP